MTLGFVGGTLWDFGMRAWMHPISTSPGRHGMTRAASVTERRVASLSLPSVPEY